MQTAKLLYLAHKICKRSKKVASLLMLKIKLAKINKILVIKGKINPKIADSNYPLTINREEEQMVREAAKQVNIRLNKYREVYKNLEPEKMNY